MSLCIFFFLFRNSTAHSATNYQHFFLFVQEFLSTFSHRLFPQHLFFFFKNSTASIATASFCLFRNSFAPFGTDYSLSMLSFCSVIPLHPQAQNVFSAFFQFVQKFYCTICHRLFPQHLFFLFRISTVPIASDFSQSLFSFVHEFYCKLSHRLFPQHVFFLFRNSPASLAILKTIPSASFLFVQEFPCTLSHSLFPQHLFFLFRNSPAPLATDYSHSIFSFCSGIPLHPQLCWGLVLSGNLLILYVTKIVKCK